MKYFGTMLTTFAAVAAMAGCAGGMRNDSKTQAYQRWHETRADILVTKGEQQFKAGDLNGAGSSAKEALSLSPGKPVAKMLLARVAIEKGHYAQAMTLLDELAVVKPAAGEVPYLQAVVYERRGRYDQALRMYEKARALNPDNAAYVMASAEVMVALGQPSDALGLVETKLIGMTESAGVYCMAGDLALTVGRPQAAAGHFRKARNIAPGRSDILERLAKAHFFAGDYDRALMSLEQLANEDGYGKIAWVYVMIGDSALALGKTQRAKTAYTTATTIAPGQAAHWSKLAAASLAGKDLPRTVLSARRALNLNPGAVEASLTLGYALLAQGKIGEAGLVLTRAERTHPEDAMIKCLLGRRYNADGDPGKAREYYRAALKLEPDNTVARRMLAQVD